MKILTGQWRGRLIPFRPSPHLRPTPDKVRKAVIETLGEKVLGAVVLDVFSGTGALGFEALSAGAKEAVFVEKNNFQCASLRRFAAELGAAQQVRVLCAEASKAVPRLGKSGARFDLVFADPPYERGLAAELLIALSAPDAPLAPGAWTVIETYRSEELPEKAGRLSQKRLAVYGDTAIRYYLFEKEATHLI